jgi:hypothetical protein
LKESVGLRNTAFDELVEEVERAGLATAEEAYISIVPPFRMSEKLPINENSTEAFSDTANEARIYLEHGRYEQAESVFLWLLDSAEFFASAYEGQENWAEACDTYIRLCSACDYIKGGGDYADRAGDAMSWFCERMLIRFSMRKDNP